ncbi:MAG: transporter substrate-binding domain-containing protein [Magnetospirillum sp.]|nr:transporter substrate-binding domain-containing protein [Magnetospirillum sp.]
MGKVIGLLAVLLCLGGQVAARDLRFITIDVAPWAAFDPETKKITGVFPAVMDELSRRTGHNITTTLQPFARIDRELETGAQDCTVIIWNDDRSRIVRKGERLALHPIGIIAAKGVQLNTLEDAARLDGISVLRGLTLGGGFESAPRLRKEYDTDYATGLRKLAHGRVQAVAGAMPTIRYQAQQMGLSQHLGAQLLLSNIDLVLQCSLKSPNLDLMEQMNRTILDMRDDGSLDAIFQANSFS